jgi:hypothetical protein
VSYYRLLVTGLAVGGVLLVTGLAVGGVLLVTGLAVGGVRGYCGSEERREGCG